MAVYCATFLDSQPNGWSGYDVLAFLTTVGHDELLTTTPGHRNMDEQQSRR